jgi:hypothetical protein
MEISNLIDQEIENIYYSETVSKSSIFTSYVRTKSNLFAELNGYGAFLRESKELPNDMRPINIPESILPNGVYRDIKIAEVNKSGPNGQFLVLSNKFQIGITNIWFERVLHIGAYKWKPNSQFYEQPIANFDIGGNDIYREFQEFFKRYNFDYEYQVFQHLEILDHKDVVNILEIFTSEKKYRFHYTACVYLMESYCGLGQKEKALKLLKKAQVEGGWADSLFSAEKLDNIEVELQKPVVKQYQELMEVMEFGRSPAEEDFLQVIKNFIERKS